MLKLACRDLGMACDHVVEGESVAEVKEKAMAHAKEVHAVQLRAMASPAQMAQMDKLMEKMIK